MIENLFVFLVCLVLIAIILAVFYVIVVVSIIFYGKAKQEYLEIKQTTDEFNKGS